MSIPEVDSRDRLLAFLKRYFALKGEGGGGSGAPTNAQYVTLATNGSLSAERVLTAGSNISLTDGGAGGTLTIAATAGGDVSVSGTPSNNQIPTWTDSTTIKGESNLTFDGTDLTLGAGGPAIISTGGTFYLKAEGTDMKLSADSDMYLDIDENNNGNNNSLCVRAGSNATCLRVAETGNVHTANNAVITGSANVAGTLSVAKVINHIGDADTLIAFTTDQIDIECGAKPRIKLDGTGVGLMGATPIDGVAITGDLEPSGDTTMAGTLTVNGATILHSNAAARLRVRDTTANYQVALGITDSGGGPGIDFGDSDSTDNAFMSIGSWSNDNNVDTKARDFHIFGTTTTTGFYFDESEGKFGLGSSAPQALLHLEAASTRIRLADSNSTTDENTTGAIDFYRGNNTNQVGMMGFLSSQNQHISVWNSTATGSFAVYTANSSTKSFAVDYQGSGEIKKNFTVGSNSSLPVLTLGSDTSAASIKDSAGQSRFVFESGGNTVLYGAGGTATLIAYGARSKFLTEVQVATNMIITGSLEVTGNLSVNGGLIDFSADSNPEILGGTSNTRISDADGTTRVQHYQGGRVYLRDSSGTIALQVGASAATDNNVKIASDLVVGATPTFGGNPASTDQRAEFLDSGGASRAGYNGAYWEMCQASNALANTVLTASNQQYDMLGPAWSTTTLYHYGTSATPASTAGNVRRATDGSAANNFTGQHNVSPANSELVENLEDNIGLIVIANGSFKRWDERPSVEAWVTGKEAITIAEALPCVELAAAPNDKRAFGVISNRPNEYLIDMDTGEYEEDQDGIAKGFGNIKNEQVRINSIGEGAIWVCNVSGNLENGDYITTCEIPGLGMKQDDDLLHNYTVAKITQDCDFRINASNYNVVEFEHSGSTYRKAFVGCTYHCG